MFWLRLEDLDILVILFNLKLYQNPNTIIKKKREISIANKNWLRLQE